MDTRLGNLSVHLDTPQCFSAEMYSADLNITGKPEDDKVFARLFASIAFLFLLLSLHCILCGISGFDLPVKLCLFFDLSMSQRVMHWIDLVLTFAF